MLFTSKQFVALQMCAESVHDNLESYNFASPCVVCYTIMLYCSDYLCTMVDTLSLFALPAYDLRQLDYT